MSKALKAAFGVSMESDDAALDDVIEMEFEEGREGPTPDQYVSEREEAETDIETLNQVAQEIEEKVSGGEEIAEASLESMSRLVNAVMHRYGAPVVTPALESHHAPQMLAHEIRQITASMESALDVSLEGFQLSDLWDRIGQMDRELKVTRDIIQLLKNAEPGTIKINMLRLYKMFMVSGTVPKDLASVVSQTVKVMDELLAESEKAFAAARKAADIAGRVDWSDDAAANEAIKKISTVSNPATEIVRKFRSREVMLNREVKAKELTLKRVPAKGWDRGASVKLTQSKWSHVESWMIGTGMLVGPAAMLGVAFVMAGVKREVKLKEFVVALEQLVKYGEKVTAQRQKTARKWTEHKKFVSELKDTVKGSAAAKATRRSIIELDRLGWQMVHAAFSNIASTIVAINLAGNKTVENR